LLAASSQAYGQSKKKGVPRKTPGRVTTKAPKRKPAPPPAAAPSAPAQVNPPPIASPAPPTPRPPADAGATPLAPPSTVPSAAPPAAPPTSVPPVTREIPDVPAVEPDPPPVVARAHLPIVVVGIEPRWEARYYRHTEFTAPNVRAYDANGYAAIAASIELYPLARAARGFWQNLGLSLRYAQAFGFESESIRLGRLADLPPLPVDTSFVRYAIGMRYRMKLSRDEPRSPMLGIAAGYSRWIFDFSDALPRGPDLEAPTAYYQMAFLGVDASFPIGPVTISGAVTYLHGVSIAAPSSRELDDLQYWHLFTAVGEGAELRLGAGLALWGPLEMRLSLEYALLVYHLRPLRGRADEPGRVIDSYVSAGLGPYVRF
jgi:hypothetical protein